MTEKNNIYNNIPSTPQDIYDSYNTLVFSNDTRVIHRMITKNNIYNEVKHLNGDIIECGVFKGASLALWLQLIKLHEPNSLTSIVGFDFFDTKELLDGLDGANKKMMDMVVSRADNQDDLKMENILSKCEKILPYKVELVKGDVCHTCKPYVDKNPGLRVKLLYLDMDVDEPTFSVLETMWDRIVIGGIILLDEYGLHIWDEANGVDRFLKTIKDKYQLKNTNVISPTLIIKKTDY